ncbi:copper resistance protein NlpE [Suttonella sp. R2A3]|uniref:copper resistance protein NlpE n=1 Tax=Suttonella sp. R2A3 TaxID=2908648 RepID=UPI001F2EB552|nr:copper resistance protein NlpE [Suttonella sp. R2A3]UJF24013.1 copper resistance protein NlpE [Suttonella sp. R2A3]
MFKTHYGLLLAAAGLSVGSIAQAAQCGGEVQFAKGMSSTQLQGEVAGDEICTYTFRAKEGQQLNVSFAEGNRTQAFLYRPVSKALSDDQPFILPESGQYELRVGLTRNDARKYTNPQAFSMDLSITAAEEASALTTLAQNAAQQGNQVYQGVLPCASCSGIEYTLTLNADGSYALEEIYQGQGEEGTFTSQGQYAQDGAVITLTNSKDAGEKRYLYQKDSEAFLITEENVAAIEGMLQGNYRLKLAQ